MDNLRFSSIAKRYATGISFTVRSKIAYRRSPRARTPAAYFKACSRPFATPFFRSPFMTWPNKSATALRENTPPGYFLNPQGSRLCWHYGFAARVLEQLRAKYRLCAVRALSAAVRPAFAVPIYAPGWQDAAFAVSDASLLLKNFYKFSKTLTRPSPLRLCLNSTPIPNAARRR